MVIDHFPQMKFAFPSLLNYPVFDPSFALLFLKVVFHDGTNKVFPKLFLPELSVQFSARKLSSVK